MMFRKFGDISRVWYVNANQLILSRLAVQLVDRMKTIIIFEYLYTIFMLSNDPKNRFQVFQQKNSPI